MKHRYLLTYFSELFSGINHRAVCGAKMLRCLVLAALMMGSVNVWGETVTYTYTFTTKEWTSDNGNWTYSAAGSTKASAGVTPAINSTLVICSPVSYGKIVSVQVQGTCNKSASGDYTIYKSANSGTTITGTDEQIGTKSYSSNSSSTTAINDTHNNASGGGYVKLQIHNASTQSSKWFYIKSVIITYETAPAEPIYNYWYVNGEEHDITETTTGKPVLPAAPEVDCDGRVFVGWTTEAYKNYEHDTDKPAVLFKTAAEANTYTTTDGETFYALFAKEEGGGSTTETANIDFSTQSYEKQQEISTVSIDDNITATFDKGTNSNAPKYYTSGTAIRLYGGGTLTIASSADNITAISLTFGSSDGSNDITADVGTWSSPNWSGSSKSVVLSIGGTSGNRRINGISVTYTSTGGTTHSDYVTSCKTKDANTLAYEDQSVDLNTPFELFDAITDYNSGGNITYAFVGEHDGASISITDGNYYFTGNKVGTYVIRATQEEDASTQAATVEFTICVRLATPTNLTQAVTTPTARLSWNGVDGATGYIVEMLSDDNSSVLASYETTNTYYDLSNLTLNDYYIWGVIATNGTACCNSAQETSAFTAEAVSFDGKWTIDWQPTSGVTEWSRQAFTGDYTNAASGEFKIENFTLPTGDCQFWVGYGGVYGNHWGGNSNTVSFSGNITFANSQSAGKNPYPGDGAWGTLRIYGNSGSDNKYITFIPKGYNVTYGIEDGAAWTNVPFTWKEGTTWETAEVEIANTYDADNTKYCTGATKANGTTAWGGKSNTIAMSGLYDKMAAGVHGIFRMSDAAGEDSDNFSTTFIPYYNILYHDYEGNVTKSDYISSENTSALSITLPTPAARAGWTFVGWAHNPEGTGDIVEGGKTYGLWQPNDPLYQIWKENKYTITWSVNGTTYSTDVKEGVNPTQPTDIDLTGGCDYTFKGWTATAITGSQTTAPADLFDSEAPEAASATSPKTYYAVFAQESAGGSGEVEYTLVQSLTSLHAGDAYLGSYLSYSGARYYYMNSSDISSNTLSMSNATLSSNILQNPSSTGKVSLVSTGIANQYYIKNAANEYLYSESAGSLSWSSNECAWTFSDIDEYGRTTLTSSLTSGLILRGYGTSATEGKLKTYSKSSNYGICVFVSSATTTIDYVTSYSCVSHNLTIAVNGSGTTTPAVGTTTTIYENHTTTIEATPAEGYYFAGWTVTGAGASTADAKAVTTELTMGTEDVTVTANFVPKATSRYLLVTDLFSLTEGDVLLIADNTSNVVAKNEIGSESDYTTLNYLLSTYATFSEDKTEITGLGDGFLSLRLSGVLEAWVLTNPDNKQLSIKEAASDKFQWDNTAANTWTISIDATADRATTIRNTNKITSQERSIAYNPGTQVFKYIKDGTSLNAIQLYRKVAVCGLTAVPTTTEYPIGGSIDPNTVTVTATYTDGTSKTVTGATFTPDFTTAGENKTVVVSYTEDGRTVTTEFTVTVYDPNVKSTITFYNDEEEYDIQEVGYKQTVSQPADPATCGDYIFLGWTEAETIDANTQPTLFDFSTPIIVSKTLRAVYQTGEYIEETYVIEGTDTDKATITPALPDGVTLTYQGPKVQMSGGKSIIITSTGWNVTIDKILINTKTSGDMKDEGRTTNFTLQVGTETTTYKYVGESHATQHDFTIFDGIEGVQNSGQGDIILTYSTSISSVWIYTTTLYTKSDNRTFTLTSPCAPALESTEVAAITSSKDITATSAQGTITALRTASEPTALSATVTGTDASLFTVTTSAFAQDGENHVATYHVSYTPTGTEQATHQATVTFSATYDGKTLTYEVPITGYTVPESFAIVAHDGTNWIALPGNMDAADTYETATVDLDDTTNPTAVTRLPQVMVYNLLGVHADNAATSFGKVRIQNQSTTECLWASKSETSIKNDGQNASGATANYEWTFVTDNGTNYKLYNANHGGYLGINDGHWGMYAEGKAATVRFLPYNSICATIPAPSNLSVVATSLNEIVLTFLPIKNTEYYTIDHYEYRQANDTEWTQINELTANDNMLEFKVTGLEQDKAYTFYLRGCATEESQLCGERGENKITVSTTAPYVDIVAWGEKSITVNVDNAPDNMTVQVSQEVVVTSGSGIVADELFFSKYYEATGNLKLLGIYNGTDHDIDLTNYHIYMAKTHDDKGNETGQIFTEQNSTYIIEFSDLTSSLGGAPTTIKAGTEIILYNDAGDLADVISDDDPATTDESMGTCIAGNVPGATFENGQLVAENWYYHKNISWSGDRAIALYKDSEDGTSKEMIDIIGAWKDVDGKAVIDGSGIEAPSNYKSQGFEGDDPAWFAQGIQYNTDPSIQVPCVLSTNRCLLVRLNTVKSGMNAVTQNKGDFHTLATEWRGENVGGGSSGVQDLHVCQSFSIVSSFDYAKYYVIYQNLGEATTLTKNEDGTYTIPLANNTADLACKRMKLEFSSGTEVFTTKEVRIPIIISEPQTTAGKSFEALKTIHSTTDGTTTVEGDVAEICKTCDVVIQDNVVLTHTEGGNTTIQHLIVDAGAKLSVEKGQQFNVSSITLRSEGDKVPHLVLPDATSELASAQKMLTFTKRIKNDRYYFFSLPFNCNVSDIRLSNGGGVYNVDFLIKEYDGEMRATEGTGNDIKTWKIVDATAMLQAGKGYALAVSHSEDVEVVFPMMLTNTALHLVDNNAKGVAITAHGFDTEGNVTSAKAHNHLGWNFVGNPYFTSYGTLDDTDLKYGMINITNGITGDTWIEDGFLYINVPENGDQIYVQHRAQDKTINPFSAFFVQVATSGRLEYTPTTRVIPQSLAPRRAPAATAQPVYVGISLSNGVQSDETSLVISDHFTQDYEVGSDLEKMLGLGTKPQLYIKDNNYKYAFKALNEHDAANANMLGVYLPAKAETEYTIALMENYDLSQVQAVYLHDNVEGITINLMQTPYTFTHGYAHNTTRFALSAVLAPRMTTDLSNVPTTWAVWQDAPLHVRLEGLTAGDRICVIDATGQLVYETITTTSSGEISLPTAGAYCIETIGQAGLQVKKVIVK